MLDELGVTLFAVLGQAPFAIFGQTFTGNLKYAFLRTLLAMRPALFLRCCVRFFAA